MDFRERELEIFDDLDAPILLDSNAFDGSRIRHVRRLGAYGETLCSFIARTTYWGSISLDITRWLMDGFRQIGGNPIHNSEILVNTELQAVAIS